MEKFILMLLCTVLLFCCSGCNTDDVSSETKDESQYETNSDWEPWQ